MALKENTNAKHISKLSILRNFFFLKIDEYHLTKIKITKIATLLLRYLHSSRTLRCVWNQLIHIHCSYTQTEALLSTRQFPQSNVAPGPASD